MRRGAAYLLICFALSASLTSCSRSQPAKPVVAHRAGVHVRPSLTYPEWLICLDAGHGGEDPGALSPDETIQEKNITLATTFMARDHLKALGYRVMLTRTDDTFIPLEERAERANAADATLFVSIHYNASPNPEGQGLEVFCFTREDKSGGASEASQLAEEVLACVHRYTRAPMRGVKEENFAVLRKTRMPAVLIEGGFLTNAEELALLSDPNYLNAIAWGVARGIDAHLCRSSPARFERTACCLGGNRSIQLSYGDKEEKQSTD